MKYRFILSALLPFLILLLSASNNSGKSGNEVPGRILVQFNAGFENDITGFVKSFDFADLKAERCLSAGLNIWLLSFDNTRLSSAEIITRMKDDNDVSLVQAEHYISLREVFPDDPTFAMQWPLYNIGQTGGLADADIDATLAWDVSVNNGTTALGDTIVIAVIDDGFYLAHEDMDFWKNRNEIPGNDIDDDGNGYIDDFDGWNAYTGTGVIPSKSHGSRVAGIAGAIGDNNTGICGVGWHNRILPVAGSSTFEATVVEALAYVYKMRSLYDESNGEKGAYIVATNGSFGVDYANPADYPVWHMMYDSLGSLGILNAAATMNHASDVEIAGDVPTSFDTEYLIAVTNTTKSDEKYDVAAWGAVSIDLGAPGSSVLSTSINDTYGYTTGTSVAAPHVAGSIALLFSAADIGFLEQYQETPSKTALFLKELILDGVDTLNGFDTLCVSGGRLNVNNTLQLLINPRIEIPYDTLSVYLGMDTSVSRMVPLTNRVGFELAYYCSFQSLPVWIDYYNASGYLPGYGHQNLAIGFRTGDLDFGTYHSTIEIRDDGGRTIPLVLELNVIPDLGLDEPPGGFDVFIYPNPFVDRLNIEVHGLYGKPCKLFIYNLSGGLVYEQRIQSEKMTWQAASLPSGVYILQIEGEKGYYQQKVVKL